MRRPHPVPRNLNLTRGCFLGRDKVEPLTLLLQAGAGVDAQDSDGLTAFAWAAANDATASARALLEAGADDIAHHCTAEKRGLPELTAQQLAGYDGSQQMGPYVAVLGLVYDMTKSANFYGPGGN